MIKHTPGPWRLSSDSSFIIKQDYTRIGLGDRSGVLIGSACGHPASGFFPSEEEARANARLIAAAPDLLEALQSLLETANAAISSGDWKVDGACDPDRDLIQAARAIAKATGEQP